MNLNINTKRKLIITITLLIVFIMSLGASYAFFAGNISNLAKTNITAKTNTVDDLQFIHGNQISLTVNPDNFGYRDGNISGTTYVGAILTPNNANNTASYNYQVYLDIAHNGIKYSTENTSSLAELMVSATDQNGNEVTLSNLGTKKTVTYYEGNTQKSISGYDITGVVGLKQILVDRTISTSNNSTPVEQRINVTVTYINHDFDQTDSAGKYASIDVIIQKDPITIATFLPGENFNTKIKQLSSGDNSVTYEDEDDIITNIERSDTILSQYKSANYAVSVYSSISGEDYPIYAWVDNGTLYWYSEADRVKLNADASNMFASLYNLESIDDLDDIYTRETTNMDSMFSYAGNSATNFNLDLGDNFDTSSVTTMNSMFFRTGYSATDFSFDIGDNFDTSNVTTMNSMFSSAGLSATNFNLDLGDKFDTSNVTLMKNMFEGIGYWGQTFSLDLGDKFDTSKVTDMRYMFRIIGYSANSFELDLGDKFDTSSVTFMSGLFESSGRNATTFSLDLGDKFDTSNATTIAFIFSFAGRSATTFSLNLGDRFDISNAKTITEAFYNLGNSATDNYIIDLSKGSFPTVFANLYSYKDAFKGLNLNKCTIYVKDAASQQWIVNHKSDLGNSNLSTSNVLIKP